MSKEIRKYIDTFKERITENLNISEDSTGFTMDDLNQTFDMGRSYRYNDLKRAFEAGRRMKWTDINQEEQEPYYYSFEQWFDETKSR